MRQRSLVEAYTAEWLRKYVFPARGARIDVSASALTLSWRGFEVRELWSDPLDYPECLKQAANAVARFRDAVAQGT